MDKRSQPGEELSELELLILRTILNVEGIEEMAKVAKVPPSTLGKEIALLQIKGYIATDGRLTEKGREAVGRRVPRLG